MDLGGFVLGFPLLYLKGMRIMMFQLSGFYFKPLGSQKNALPNLPASSQGIKPGLYKGLSEPYTAPEPPRKKKKT